MSGTVLLVFAGCSYLYPMKRGGGISYERAYAAAINGDPKGQCAVGVCYAYGLGVATNHILAMSWFRRAAERNLAGAQCNLGVCYGHGWGVETNHDLAVSWFRRAAEANEAVAQYNLGVAYAKGLGVAKDEAEAVTWYRKSAEAGYTNALNKLAWILATSPNRSIRNAGAAVFYAKKAVAATSRKAPQALDTLAAAYAEAGEFEKAIKTQVEAMTLLTAEAEQREDYSSRLKLYQAGTPYRMPD